MGNCQCTCDQNGKTVTPEIENGVATVTPNQKSNFKSHSKSQSGQLHGEADESTQQQVEHHEEPEAHEGASIDDFNPKVIYFPVGGHVSNSSAIGTAGPTTILTNSIAGASETQPNHQNSQNVNEVKTKRITSDLYEQKRSNSNESAKNIIEHQKQSSNLRNEDNQPIIAVTTSNVRVKHGPIKLKNGAVYTGEWKNGKRDGFGKHAWSDGSSYEGEWLNDKAHGIGKLIHADGDIYEGEWENDMANGKGSYLHQGGAKYVGNWKNDVKCGEGVETWPDGSKYEGNYLDGKINGFGTLHFQDGSQYKGGFKDTHIEGIGCYTWKDGKVYNGAWKANKMNGEGELKWPDNRKYKGGFLDDKKHGYGVLEWANDRRYQGEWLHGKQHGKGVLIINGETKEGIWEHGKRAMWVK